MSEQRRTTRQAKSTNRPCIHLFNETEAMLFLVCFYVMLLLPTDLIQPKLKNKMWWPLNGKGGVTNMKHPITHISVYPQFKWNNGCPLTHHDKLNMPWQAHRWTRMTHLWGIVSMKQWLIMIYPTAHSLTCYVSDYGTGSCKQLHIIEGGRSRQKWLFIIFFMINVNELKHDLNN